MWPLASQWVAMCGGSLSHASHVATSASAAITKPNHRLRISASRERFHEVPGDFLEDGGVQPVPHVLPLPLHRDEPGVLQDAEVVRHRGKRDRKLLRQLAG